MPKRSLAALAAMVTFAANPAAAENILILLADDIGTDVMSATTDDPSAAPTPVIEALANQGVSFTKAWAQPLCSPSRATLLTGLSPLAHGVTRGIKASDRLDPDFTTFADLAVSQGYETYAVGKWDLAGSRHAMTHPLEMGFQHHAGTRHQLGDYYGWLEYLDGAYNSHREDYATTVTVDQALEWIQASPGPWLMYVAFNAAHKPFHAPPQHLHDYTLTGDPTADAPTHYRAAVQALDSEIGRLLDGIAPAVLADTTIFFLGDNGTLGDATIAPRDASRAKGTPYAGGVEVPLIVTGKAVPPAQAGTRRDHPVQLEDVFATVAQRLGRSDAIPNDAHGFSGVLRHPSLSLRSIQTAHIISPTRDRHTAQSGCYKLLRPGLGADFEIYNRCNDPLELAPIDLEAQSAHAARQAFLQLAPLLPVRRQCDDGIDNDEDGLTDLDDPGCTGTAGDDESPPCSDGIDNDGDGAVDFDGAGLGAADPYCQGDPAGLLETPYSGCGLGFEGALVAVAALALRARRLRARLAG